jgi:hypothetical protein
LYDTPNEVEPTSSRKFAQEACACNGIANMARLNIRDAGLISFATITSTPKNNRSRENPDFRKI